MLRKLIFFAISSGLTKKAYDLYKSRNPQRDAPPTIEPPPDFGHTLPAVRLETQPEPEATREAGAPVA